MRAQRSWVRWIGLVVLMLCAGLILNVLIAWGGMVVTPAILGPVTFVGNMTRRVGVAEPLERGWPLGAERTVARQAKTSFGRGMSETIVTEGLELDLGNSVIQGRVQFAFVWHAGWPLRSVCCAEIPNSGELRGGFRVGTLTNSIPGSPPRPLPYWPVWPGFAVDTLLYAGVLMLGVCGWRWARRRLPPGHCRGCGYDLSGLGDGVVCPECGGAS